MKKKTCAGGRPSREKERKKSGKAECKRKDGREEGFRDHDKTKGRPVLPGEELSGVKRARGQSLKKQGDEPGDKFTSLMGKGRQAAVDEEKGTYGPSEEKRGKKKRLERTEKERTKTPFSGLCGKPLGGSHAAWEELVSWGMRGHSKNQDSWESFSVLFQGKERGGFFQGNFLRARKEEVS